MRINFKLLNNMSFSLGGEGAHHFYAGLQKCWGHVHKKGENLSNFTKHSYLKDKIIEASDPENLNFIVFKIIHQPRFP